MATITVWLRVTRVLEPVLLAAILSRVTNLYRWGATNLLGIARNFVEPNVAKWTSLPELKTRLFPFPTVKRQTLSLVGLVPRRSSLPWGYVIVPSCDMVCRLFSFQSGVGCNCLWSPNADSTGTQCTGPADSDVICTTDILNYSPGVCSVCSVSLYCVVYKCYNPSSY